MPFCVRHTPKQSALEMGQEAGMVQIYFSDALTGSTFKGFSSALLCGSWRFSAVCSDIVSLNWSQCVVVDGSRSKLVNVVSEVPQGSVFLSVVVPLVHRWALLYSGKQALRVCWRLTLVAAVPSPVERVAVTDSMNRNLYMVSVWCDLLGMKLIAVKTKTMIVIRSRTVHP